MDHPHDKVPMIYRPWMVLGLLFLALGFLGIPLLVKSPCFSKPAKWFWSIVVTVYTLALIALTVWIVMLMLERFRELSTIFETY